MTKKVFATRLTKKRKSVPSAKMIKENKKKSKKEIKLGTWSAAEDKILDEWVKSHGPQKWVKCAELIKERTGKQCRDHWLNKLKSNLSKGYWTSEEDLLIMRFYAKYKSWNKIIPIFEGRAENSIKNRFFSELRKIATKKQGPGKKESVSQIKLNRLTQFIDEAVKKAEERYFKENKNMTKADFEKYISKIEQELNNKDIKKKNIIKYIDLKTLKNNIIKDNSNSPKIIKVEHNKNKYENINTDKNYKDNNIKEKSQKIEDKSYNLSEIKNFFENMNNLYNNNILNNKALKEDAKMDYNSENDSSITSSEDNDSVVNEELKKNNHKNVFETYLQTTRNIENIKKGKIISLNQFK